MLKTMMASTILGLIYLGDLADRTPESKAIHLWRIDLLPHAHVVPERVQLLFRVAIIDIEKRAVALFVKVDGHLGLGIDAQGVQKPTGVKVAL